MTDSGKGLAVVTGAASGIGAAYADRLARRGYDLILVARSAEKLQAVARRVAGTTGRAVACVEADLDRNADLKRIEALLRAKVGISMLVNNPGVGEAEPLPPSKVDVMKSMIALSTITMSVVPAFVARRRGAVINISSAVGAPEPLKEVYGALPPAVLAFSLSLHKHVAQNNVRVQAVLAGASGTNRLDAVGASVDELPGHVCMASETLVDSALAEFDEGDLVTTPNLADWGTSGAVRPMLMQTYESRFRRHAAAA